MGAWIPADLRTGMALANVVGRMKALFLVGSLVLPGFMGAQQAVSDSLLIAQVNALAAATDDTLKARASDALRSSLHNALIAPDAFTRGFEGVPLSRIDAPDGTFRLFTWNIPWNDGTHRYHGWLLVRDKKKAAVIELRDATSTMERPEYITAGADRWYGALYYAVVPVKKGGRTIHTLLGWKGYSNVETRKVVEVLSLKGTTPRFGYDVFETLDAKGRVARVRKSRLVHGFNFQVKMSLKWDDTSKRIVLDHLSPSRADLEGQWPFYGPDLSYDAYVWDKSFWHYLRDVDAREGGSDKPWNRPPKE